MQPFSLGALTPRSFNVSAASNATPIIVTTSAPHSFKTGDLVTLTGVGGNTAANGSFSAQVVSPSQVLLVGSAGNGGYTFGGTISAPTQLTLAANDNNPIVQLVERITFVPRVTNTQVTFAGVAGLNQTTGAAVLREMNPNTSGTGGRLDWLNLQAAGNLLSLGDYWIDCKVPTESVIVAYFRR